MQQFFDPKTGVRYNIVIPPHLSGSQKSQYEELLRRGIVDRLGHTPYQPRSGAYRPRVPSSTFDMQNIRLPSLAQQQQQQPHQPLRYVFHNQEPQHGARGGNASTPMGIISGASNNPSSQRVDIRQSASRNPDTQRHPMIPSNSRDPNNRNLQNGSQI